MKIHSAQFVRGVAGTDPLLADGTPQIALIGRSNVGKSSLINSLTGQPNLARTSDMPGRTQEINIYMINACLYLLDLPGYGYVQGSHSAREKIQKLIYWYLWDSHYQQKKIFLIIDAHVGATTTDLEMLHSLERHEKSVTIVANKIDKIKPSAYETNMKKLQEVCGNHNIIPYSSFGKPSEHRGLTELTAELFS